MPFPLTFPDLWPARVDTTRLAAQSLAQSPFTLQQQVYDFGGRAWKLNFRMQRMVAEDAAVMLAFLAELDGIVGSFTFDLDPWCPGIAPAPGEVTFRLTGPPSITSDFGVTWDIAFEAIEVIEPEVDPSS